MPPVRQPCAGLELAARHSAPVVTNHYNERIFGVQSSLSFHGYLAPRFTSPDTPFPNYFFDYSGAKRIAHMMVHTP